MAEKPYKIFCPFDIQPKSVPDLHLGPPPPYTHKHSVHEYRKLRGWGVAKPLKKVPYGINTRIGSFLQQGPRNRRVGHFPHVVQTLW